MAFQQGNATDHSDLFSELSTFLTANGWTEDERDDTNGQYAFSKNTIYPSFRSDPADEQVISVHQALGFINTTTEPGDHTDDSGNGYNSDSSHSNGSLDNERHVDLGSGPYPNYWFFENDASPAYCHIVVEISAGVYRHFGFGELVKHGTWTGGEYCYGHTQNNGAFLSNLNTFLLDGRFDTTGVAARTAATVHCESLPGQAAGSKWGQVWGGTDATPPDDTGTNAKVNVVGAFRAGPVARGFGNLGGATSTAGLVPMYPLHLFYRDNANARLYPLGYMEDVRGVNIKNFAAEQEVVIGSDTWVFFPASKKTNNNEVDRSYNAGIAYKKVTT